MFFCRPAYGPVGLFVILVFQAFCGLGVSRESFSVSDTLALMAVGVLLSGIGIPSMISTCRGHSQWLVIILGGGCSDGCLIRLLDGVVSPIDPGELVAEHALKDAAEANVKVALLEASLAQFRDR